MSVLDEKNKSFKNAGEIKPNNTANENSSDSDLLSYLDKIFPLHYLELYFELTGWSSYPDGSKLNLTQRWLQRSATSD